MSYIIPNRDVLAEQLAADAACQEGTLIENRHARVIPEHEADDIEHGRRFQNYGVLPCWNLRRMRGVNRFLGRNLG
jgi:hypothetical protein